MTNKYMSPEKVQEQFPGLKEYFKNVYGGKTETGRKLASGESLDILVNDNVQIPEKTRTPFLAVAVAPDTTSPVDRVILNFFWLQRSHGNNKKNPYEILEVQRYHLDWDVYNAFWNSWDAGQIRVYAYFDKVGLRLRTYKGKDARMLSQYFLDHSAKGRKFHILHDPANFPGVGEVRCAEYRIGTEEEIKEMRRANKGGKKGPEPIECPEGFLLPEASTATHYKHEFPGVPVDPNKRAEDLTPDELITLVHIWLDKDAKKLKAARGKQQMHLTHRSVRHVNGTLRSSNNHVRLY